MRTDTPGTLATDGLTIVAAITAAGVAGSRHRPITAPTVTAVGTTGRHR